MNTSDTGRVTQDRELQDDELIAVSGGLLNGKTQLYNAFLGGLVKGYLDAGGDVSISFFHY